jgi:exopolysaccharide production protein ExoQ
LGITLIGLLRNIFIFKLPAWFIPFSNFGDSHRDGEIFAIGLIVAIGIFIRGNKSERNLLPTIILLLVFLLLTGSRTSLIGFFISSLYLIWKLGSIGKSTKFILIFTLAVFVLSAYYIMPAQSKENIIREDSIDTLTGRIPLWYTLVYGINQNALWGTGFGAFWTVERRETIQSLVGWAAPAAHNGFLEVYLNTGLIGLFFVISLLINVWYKSKFLQGDNSIIAKSLLLYIIIQNLTQGSFQYLRIYVEVVFIWLMIFILLRRSNDNFNNNYIL